jgi:uncharacterized protein (DUF58 family)
MPDTSPFKYLPSQFADRLRGLGMSVRRPMDGGRQGLHRSSTFGASVEFAEYRMYSPGDPIRRIDWPVFARTDRYMIRQFHEEVSVRCHILLDISESMAYSQNSTSKLDFARYLAAGMMFVMAGQGDTAGLVTFDDELRDVFPPASSLAMLKPQLERLETVTPERPGRIEACLHSAAERIGGRCLVVVVSDLLQDPAATLAGLSHLVHDGKEVTVFHVVDPAELTLPMSGLYEIEGLEGEGRMTVDIGQIRAGYLEQVRDWLEELRTGCMARGVGYHLADTNSDPYVTIQARCTRR